MNSQVAVGDRVRILKLILTRPIYELPVLDYDPTSVG